jgi:hypothetical protein
MVGATLPSTGKERDPETGFDYFGARCGGFKYGTVHDFGWGQPASVSNWVIHIEL